jgi:hypothetical protein
LDPSLKNPNLSLLGFQGLIPLSTQQRFSPSKNFLGVLVFGRTLFRRAKSPFEKQRPGLVGKLDLRGLRFLHFFGFRDDLPPVKIFEVTRRVNFLNLGVG